MFELNTWLNADEMLVLHAFAEAGVRFVIVGGHAVQFHGYPRITKDLDVLVEPCPQNGRRLRAALKAVNTDLSEPDAVEKFSEGSRVRIRVWHYPVECLTAINGVRFADAWTDSVSTTVDGSDRSRPVKAALGGEQGRVYPRSRH